MYKEGDAFIYHYDGNICVGFVRKTYGTSMLTTELLRRGNKSLSTYHANSHFPELKHIYVDCCWQIDAKDNLYKIGIIKC